MNETNENKLVPKLRFPEFVDNGDWKEETLKQLSDVISGQSPVGESYNEEGIGAPFYQGKTDFGNIFLKKPTKWTTEPTKFANSGDILMSVRAPVGALNITTREVCIGRGLAAIQPKENKWFLFYFLNRIQNNIIGNGGSVFDSINKEQIEKIGVLIPAKQGEQQKIADCLSSLDEVITAESQKLKVLKEHKKGLLQNIFPQAGKTVPKLRFNEFESSGKWAEKSLGEIADVSKLAGYEFTKHIVYENIGNIVALRGLNIKNNKLDLSDVKYIDNSEFSKLNRSKLFVDDLMFTYIGTIGEVALIDKNDSYYLAPNVSRIRANKKEVNAQFLLQYFNIPDFREKEVTKYISSSSQPALTMKNVRKFKIYIPPTFLEQEKIAACLSSVDDLINAQTQKIEALKLHKKGLLQGLFPDLNEVNG